MPLHPGLFRGEVAGSVRMSPSTQRLTVTGDAFATFPWQGYDHWFRLFFTLPHQDRSVLPQLSGSKWWEP